MGQVSPEVQGFITYAVTWRDNGNPPRSDYGTRQYDSHKVGLVNHIPVCSTLAQLDAYFCGGSAQGSTHFGTGRELLGQYEAGGYRFPVGPVSQYMAVSSRYSPWAQGILSTNPACPIPPAPILRDYHITSGVPNAAFVSIENVAMTGSDGMTEPQFNSNVMLRAWAAQLYDHEISPYTQLWHAECDPLNRCSDTGWDGALEDAAQSAANAVLLGDYSQMKGAVSIAPPPDPTPVPPDPIPPTPPNGTDWKALYKAELDGQLLAFTDDGIRAAVRIDQVNAKLAALG